MLDTQPAHNVHESQDAPLLASTLFNHASDIKKPAAQAISALRDFRHAVETNKEHLSDEEFDHAEAQVDLHQEQVEAAKYLMKTERMRRTLAELKSVIAELDDPEAPGIGKEFLQRFEETNCRTVILSQPKPEDDDKKRPPMAVYSSFSYAPDNFGFANEIVYAPNRLKNKLDFFRSDIHERIHSFQNQSAPALFFSPFNPETKIMIHPEDWLMVENLCERDAFTKQALLSSLLDKKYPGMKKESHCDVVNVTEFEQIRSEMSSLVDTVVKSSLTSLTKIKNLDKPQEGTFVESYQKVAILENYTAAMDMRTQNNESEFTFIRLEKKDFWAIGNYHVGPNSLGEFFMEPLLMKRPTIIPEVQAQIDSLCFKYNIPSLHECQTLSEVTGAMFDKPVNDNVIATEQNLPAASASAPAPSFA